MIEVECPLCNWPHNNVTLELWEANGGSKLITCEKCKQVFVAKFDLAVNYEVFILKQQGEKKG